MASAFNPGCSFANSQDLFLFKGHLFDPNSCGSSTCSSSDDTFNLKIRHDKLEIAISSLRRTCKLVIETIEHLIQKPVDILAEELDDYQQQSKQNLQKSEKKLRAVVVHLSKGLKTLRESMMEQSKAIQQLTELDEQDIWSRNSSLTNLPNFVNDRIPDAKGVESEGSHLFTTRNSQCRKYRNTTSITTDLKIQRSLPLCVKIESMEFNISYANTLSSVSRYAHPCSASFLPLNEHVLELKDGRNDTIQSKCIQRRSTFPRDNRNSILNNDVQCCRDAYSGTAKCRENMMKKNVVKTIQKEVDNLKTQKIEVEKKLEVVGEAGLKILDVIQRKCNNDEKVISTTKDMENVVKLIVKLKCLQSKAESDINGLRSNSCPKKKGLAEGKRRMVQRQIEEAQGIKESVENCSAKVNTMLKKCLSETEYHDYNYYVQMKLILTIEKLEIEDQIMIGLAKLLRLGI